MEFTKKRVHDEESYRGLVSDNDSSQVGSLGAEVNVAESKRRRVDSDDSCSSSPESSWIEEAILDIVDDPESDMTVQGLDSVVGSFEEGFLGTDCSDLGYLREASDNELGLPPAPAPDGEQGLVGAGWFGESGEFGLTGDFWFEDIPGGYDEYGLGAGPDCWRSGYGGGDCEFVAVGGLFD